MREPFVKEVNSIVEELAEVKEAIKEYRADQKLEGGSMYSAVDKILEKYKIFRSAYHAGQVNRVGIKLLMDNAEAIMDEVKDLMLGKLRPDAAKTEDDIVQFCTDVKLFFALWDDAFAAVHKCDPTY